MMNKPKTKNDNAWEQLFNRYSILEEVNKNGQFIISSAQINKFRESRLMAKFDQSINLPQIFLAHKLSILPVSRSEYIIAPIDTHYHVTYGTIPPEPAQLPSGIKSIDYSNLYSEAIALNWAFNDGIIDEMVEEKTFHTVSGRMSTTKFNFSISSTIADRAPLQINVDNSQCEIDGGFEGEQYFVLIEAKNYAVDDFLIRQLYYPYRLWSSKLSKKVIPILMTFSQDVFDFFIYEFATETEYNSITLVKQKRYAIAPEEITTGDVAGLLSQINVVPEPQGIPFPQANRFDRVVDLLSLLAVKPLTKDEITENYEFDARQTNYYTDAGRYLGLIDKSTDSVTREVTFSLTDEARLILSKKPKQKHLELIRKILEHNVYQSVFQLALQQGKIPEKDEISQIIVDSQININSTTAQRRASTVHSWIQWIWKQIE